MTIDMKVFEFDLVAYKVVIVFKEDGHAYLDQQGNKQYCNSFHVELILKHTNETVHMKEFITVKALCFALHTQVLVFQPIKIDSGSLLIGIETMRDSLDHHLEMLKHEKMLKGLGLCAVT